MPRFHGRRAAGLGALLLGLAGSAFSGLLFDAKDWVEGDVPPPPAFDPVRAIRVEGAAYSALRYGIDPATLVIGKDGVVRYVLVITNESGTVTALYEGIRCSTAEFKIYARSNDAQWSQVKDAAWQDLFDSPQSRHALWVAKQGVCTGAAPQTSVLDIVNALKSDRRGP